MINLFLLIIGIIFSGFFALGMYVFGTIERRFEWQFLIGLAIGLVMMIIGLVNIIR